MSQSDKENQPLTVMEKLQDLEQFYNLLFICCFICWISPNKPSLGFGGVEMFLLIKQKLHALFLDNTWCDASKVS